MKAFFILAMTIVSLNSFAQPATRFDGQSTLIIFDLGEGIPKQNLLVHQNESAKAVYDQMTAVRSVGYKNTCSDENDKSIQVIVQKKNGVSISCEKWPAICLGGTHYICESTLDAKGTLLTR